MKNNAKSKIEAALNIKRDQYRVNLNVCPAGTHLQGYIEAAFPDLEKAFGKPIDRPDGYKVSGEWIFEGDGGEVFTLYDWKCTNLYDSDFESVESFRANPRPQTFNVGGRTDATVFILWLNKKIKEAA